MPPDQNLFHEALSHHLSGQFSFAEDKYRKYIENCDSLTVACTNLAALLIKKGQHHEASLFLDRALLYNPAYPEALSNQGYLNLLSSNYEQAVEFLTRSLYYKPHLQESLHHLYTIYTRTDCLQSLLPYLERALSSSFDPDILLLHAQVLYTIEGPERALQVFNESLEKSIHELLPSIYSRLGYFHLSFTRDYNRALYCFDYSITHSATPEEADLVNKGECLRLLLQLPECIKWINKCLHVHPRSVSLINLKAAVNRQAGDNNSALTLFNLALKLDSTNTQILINKALCLCDLGDIPQALSTLILTRKIDPQNAFCLQALGEIYFKNAQPVYALQSFLQSIYFNPRSFDAWDSILYFLSFTRVASTLERSKLVDSYHAALSTLPSCSFNSPSSCENRPLRVGILSAEIGNHAVSFFLESLLLSSNPDKTLFFVFPTRDRSHEKAWSTIKDSVYAFVPIYNIDDNAAHRLILDFELDVVIDTSHHMSFNRQLLLYRRLAPVQAHYIGVHGSTYLPTIDYFIGDNIITPEEFQCEFSERLVNLSRTWVSFTPPPRLPLINDAQLSNIRFGCFNNFMKITPETIELWSSVLRAFPGTSLLLKSSLPRETDDSRKSDIIASLSQAGVDPSRVEFAPYQDSWMSHMNLYNSIDISLDTLPLTSGTTAFDSLLMGVPLVAFSSPWIGGRLSHSIMNGLGRLDLVAFSTNEYLAIVGNLTEHINKKAYSRSQMRRQFLDSELCNSFSLYESFVSTLKRLHSEALSSYSNT
ncbi:hypothetical protein [Synechococcus sp. LTW-R]|uniref:tetratricopeptide repeat protein n=1 Tax=Synechococcus sp. LTW-R TaxID=2751170 RepID=UPI001629465C|nr:hypothetical protein [Synechococcus sp. LTW-R]QNG29590.1 hypothetical protein H0O22_13005 [Synechococcus sp. LTW-R]